MSRCVGRAAWMHFLNCDYHIHLLPLFCRLFISDACVKSFALAQRHQTSSLLNCVHSHGRPGCQFVSWAEGGLTLLTRLARFLRAPPRPLCPHNWPNTPTATGLVTLEAGRTSPVAKSSWTTVHGTSCSASLDSGVPRNSFWRRHSVIATLSGTAEFHAAASVAELPLEHQNSP